MTQNNLKIFRNVVILGILILLAVELFLYFSGSGKSPSYEQNQFVRNNDDTKKQRAKANIPIPSAEINARKLALTLSPVNQQAHTKPGPEVTRKALVFVLQSDRFIQHQAQLEKWSCDKNLCNATVRLPPLATNASNFNSTAASMMESMRNELVANGYGIGIKSIAQQPEGVAIEFQLTPVESMHWQYLSDEDVANIRASTIQEYIKSQALISASGSAK